MPLSDHNELISTLTEFKTLLDTLAAVDPDTLCLPSAERGVHPPDVFNADAAKAAGFTAEAVLVMSALPYFNYNARFEHRETERSFIRLSSDKMDFELGRENHILIEDDEFRDGLGGLQRAIPRRIARFGFRVLLRSCH